MSKTNAHLTDLVSETQTTNQLLSADLERTGKVEVRRQKIEDEDRLRRQKREDGEQKRKQKLEDEKRKWLSNGAKEGWSLFKQPLAYLITAAAAWLVYYFLYVPPS